MTGGGSARHERRLARAPRHGLCSDQGDASQGDVAVVLEDDFKALATKIAVRPTPAAANPIRIAFSVLCCTAW